MRTPMMNLSNDISISNNDWYALTNQIGRMNSEQVVSMSSIGTKHCVDNIPPASKPVAFTNYDVLFAAHPSTSSIGNQCQAPPYTLIDHSHIGNRRFIVLLSIYRPRYREAAKKGDEAKCKRIALEIIKTVRQQCSGRFFRQDDVHGPWHQIEDDDASLVAAVQCTMKVKSMKLKTSSDIDVVERPSKKARCATTSSLDLLCNAAMKKVPAPNEKIPFVSKPKPFDVICSSNQTTLKENANHVGNNRLQVILDMRTKTYEASTQEKRSEIIKEVVKSIIDDSSSQFLSEVEGASSEKYLPLSREKAAICIKNALNSKFLVDLEPKICGSEAIKLVRRRNKKRALDKIERRNIDKGFMNGDVVRIPISVVPKRITHVPKAA